MAYDAVSLAARLAAFANDAPFKTDLLTDPNGFSGIDGIFRLKSGGLNERGLTVQEVTRRQSREISQPPASFVDHDRRMQAALTLAEALRRSNPDRALQDEFGQDEFGQDEIGQEDIFDSDNAENNGLLTPINAQ
jgi:hypothetical protein